MRVERIPRAAEVAGTRDFTGPVGEMRGSEYRGAFTLADGDRTIPQFTGTYAWTFAAAYGRSYGTDSGTVVNGRVRADGGGGVPLRAADGAPPVRPEPTPEGKLR